MRVRVRARINGRIPDHDGKYRDEITQEVEVEVSNDDYKTATLEELRKIANGQVSRALRLSTEILRRMGGADYTTAFEEEGEGGEEPEV